MRSWRDGNRKGGACDIRLAFVKVSIYSLEYLYMRDLVSSSITTKLDMKPGTTVRLGIGGRAE